MRDKWDTDLLGIAGSYENDCGSHQWNGEDLPLIFRSGKWFCPNCGTTYSADTVK
jgi:hypothetical protein